MDLMHSVKKFSVLCTSHVRKLEAHTNYKLYAAKSFGGQSDFNMWSKS